MGVNRDNPIIILGIPGRDEEAARVRVRLLSLSFTDEEKKIDKFVLTLDNDDLTFFDFDVLRKGTVFTLAWGYPDRLFPARRAVVKKVKGFRTLTVELNGPAYLMAVVKKSRRFENVTRAEVVRQIAEENGFSGDFVTVQDTQKRFETISQAKESDATFLARLARREGYEFWVDQSGLHWEERPLDKVPVRVIRYVGPGLGDIVGEPTIDNDITGLYGTVTISSDDPNEDDSRKDEANNDTDTDRKGLAEVTEILVVDGETGRETVRTIGGRTLAGSLVSGVDDAVYRGINAVTTGSFLDTPEKRVSGKELVVDTDQDPATAAQRAKARFRRSVQRAVKMTLSIVGDPLLAARQVVEVAGMGKRLSQRYYVKSATHEVGSGGYITTLKLISDGHGGHSTAGDGRFDIPTGRGGGKQGGEKDQALSKIQLVADIVKSRATVGASGPSARVGNPQTLDRVVSDAAARFEAQGYQSDAVVRGAMTAALTAGRASGDDDLVRAASDALAFIDQRSGQEQASSARINRQEAKERTGELRQVRSVDPETGRTTVRYVEDE